MEHYFIFSYEKTGKKLSSVLLQSYSQLNTLLLKYHKAMENTVM